MLLYLVFLHKNLYHYIHLIYMTLSHIILSRMAHYLLSYIQFTPPAHPINQNCPFWEKYSHCYRSLITCTRIHQNPYPTVQVQVSWGWGTGSPGKPQGYPCHSLCSVITSPIYRTCSRNSRKCGVSCRCHSQQTPNSVFRVLFIPC